MMPEIPDDPATYTPGFSWPKALIVLVGVGLMAVGLSMMWTPLRLLATGVGTTGEVVRIVRIKHHIAEESYTSEADLRDVEKACEKDRDWAYFPVVRFTTEDGRVVEHQSRKGSQIKSPWRLMDDTGLPERVRVRYDPADPQVAMMPLDVRVWFLPMAVAGVGFWVALTFGIFWWFARKPIVLPDSHQPERGGTTRMQAAEDVKNQAQRSPTELIKP